MVVLGDRGGQVDEGQGSAAAGAVSVRASQAGRLGVDAERSRSVPEGNLEMGSPECDAIAITAPVFRVVSMTGHSLRRMCDAQGTLDAMGCRFVTAEIGGEECAAFDGRSAYERGED